MINIDDFAKLDIRIGTITSAEKIPEADKLLKWVLRKKLHQVFYQESLPAHS